MRRRCSHGPASGPASSSASGSALRTARRRAAVALILIACAAGSVAPAESDPGQGARAKSIYVDAFGTDSSAAGLRTSVLDRLRASGKVRLADNASDAQLIVKGAGETWIVGYESADLRSHSVRQPVYTGYLSVELTDPSGQALWSTLVMPGGMRWHGVEQDMAARAVRLMLAALAKGAPENQPVAVMKGQVALAGAGSTFAAPLYQEWIESFEERQPQVQVTYQAVGSEDGIQLLEQGREDFAGSDVPVTNIPIRGTAVKTREFATMLGGVVPAYNVAGVGSDLRFTPEVLAGIYLGRITRWNDPKLRSLNRGADLPDEPIVVFHRSDGSGTSFAWTEFLSLTSADWKRAVGAGMRVSWPAGQGAAGNEALASAVANTPGAIGYVELTYAIRHQLSFGQIRNQAGRFVQANLTTLSAAARAAPGVVRFSLVNAGGADAYPVATFSWIVLPASVQDPQKGEALRQLLRWMLTSGQRECAGLGYLPLPREIADRELQQLAADAP